ncbi:MAG: hypothetical protein ACR2KC_02095 [Acidimicrobiales bacterium]
MGTGYHLLVLAHVLCVIGGVGALAYRGLYLSLARRAAPEGTAGVVAVTAQVGTLGELLFYAAFIFGLAAVGDSHSVWKFSQAWVSAAFAVFFVEIGILHGWIRRNERAYRDAAAAASPNVSALVGLERRIGLGWGAFNILIVVLVYLMVFKPGGPGG